MEGFEPEEARAFLAGVFAVAWADHAIQPEERALLEQLVSELELDSTTRADVVQWFQQAPSIDDVRWGSLPLPGRAFLYLHAVNIAKADGKMVASESAMLQRLAALMGLGDAIVEAIHNTGRLDPTLL